jgi:hypothetical protein
VPVRATRGEDLHDKPRSARVPIDFLDIKILSCLEKEPFDSADSFAEVLHVSQPTILNHVHDSLGIKLFYLRWIPHELTGKSREIRIRKCRERLSMLEGMDKGNFRNLVTGDFFQFQHSAKWPVSRDDVPQKSGS